MTQRKNTPARQQATLRLAEKRRESGMKKITVWLTGPAAAKLGRITKLHGTKDRAVCHAILQQLED